MTTAKPAAKAAPKGAAKRKAGAARDEVAAGSGADKTVEFRALTLTLPPELPSTILFDITDLEADNVVSFFRLLRSVIGPEQFFDVRNVIGEDDSIVGVEAVLSATMALLNDVVSQYGLSLGE